MARSRRSKPIPTFNHELYHPINSLLIHTDPNNFLYNRSQFSPFSTFLQQSLVKNSLAKYTYSFISQDHAQAQRHEMCKHNQILNALLLHPRINRKPTPYLILIFLHRACRSPIHIPTDIPHPAPLHPSCYLSQIPSLSMFYR